MLGCASRGRLVVVLRPPLASAVAARRRCRRRAAVQEPLSAVLGAAAAEAVLDYVWDDSYPGTPKPGTLKENIDLDEAFEMWEGREREHDGAAAGRAVAGADAAGGHPELAQPDRAAAGDPDEDEESLADSSLLDDEFDLDDEDSDSKAPLQDSVIESSQEQGATMSDFM